MVPLAMMTSSRPTPGSEFWKTGKKVSRISRPILNSFAIASNSAVNLIARAAMQCVQNRAQE